jgi:hypothetical protein
MIVGTRRTICTGNTGWREKTKAVPLPGGSSGPVRHPAESPGFKIVVKFPNLRFHDLRHEATSRLFEKGLNIMEVASITGHKDLRSLQRYTHLKAEDLAEKLG